MILHFLMLNWESCIICLRRAVTYLGRKPMKKLWSTSIKPLNLKPEFPDIYEPLIVFKYDFKWDWQGTLEAIKKGLKQFPNSLEIQHCYAAFLFLRAEQVPESIAIMKKVVALRPDVCPDGPLFRNPFLLWI